MALAQEDIVFIKQHLGEWLAEQSLGKPPVVYEVELRERMVRVEEELKHQRELMLQGFEQVDKRIEQVDKRLDLMKADMDKRLDLMKADMDKRFEQVDKRFEQVDKRFEQIDKRFEQVDKRFDEMLKRHDRHFMWLVGFIVSGVMVVIGAMRYL
ncbi:hypothetical protein [Allochromatium palmeri]|uniref:DUF1640 domain-containing protein n=1 Tax=Allochromatium palmeri TaxID=231048 RepID=A0A6N8EF47_9GAMM|nr:hypothetical protein [Allochromatium palmeri]MTW21266.1 hypothetical protein [Allochromatium palmeri]